MPEARTVKARLVWASAAHPQQEVELPAARILAYYVCPRGHEFEVTLVADITDDEIPLVWRCRHHGVDGKQVGCEGEPSPPTPYADRRRMDDGRTPFDRLLERRTRSELDELLAERLAEVAAQRGGPAPPVQAKPRTRGR
jgi:RNA polymerase-binding protein